MFSAAMEFPWQWVEREKKKEEEGTVDWFLLQKSTQVMKTDAGDMRVVNGYERGVLDRVMHIGFIRMEPKTLFVPQYVDTSLILFVRQGEAKVGNIYRDDLVERRLKMGDLYRSPAGLAFYLINTTEGQRLHVICRMDTSERIGTDLFQVSGAELKEIMTKKEDGPIIYITDSHPPRMWTKFA